jgi:cobalt-zinc-cadmium efflux system outer membrane protein
MAGHFTPLTAGPGRRAAVLACAVCAALAACLAAAPPPPPDPPPVLTIVDAVRWALANNPELAAVRQQHGLAAADVVIADTYPFNPVAENRVQYASGPSSAAITNLVPLEHLLLWEVELHGQRRIRRRGAAAGLARTDWEIAAQEQALAVRVLRAASTLIYRQEKLRLVEEILRLNEQLVENVRRLARAEQLGGADLVIAQSEVDDVRTQFGAGRSTLVASQYDLLRALGTLSGRFALEGELELPPYAPDPEALLAEALRRRADLNARRAAVDEAEARVQLAIANRCGNPTVGLAFVYDPTQIAETGVQINFPLPVANLHRGEILRARAERDRALFDVRATEVQVRQDVQAALTRLRAAQAWAETFRAQTLPNLRNYLDAVERLYRAGDPRVDLLRVMDVRRKLLRARDSYLDALYEIHQAMADLHAAVGGPAVAAGPCPPPGPPAPAPPPGTPAP